MNKKIFSFLLASLLLISLTSTVYASGGTEEAPDFTTADFTYFVYVTDAFDIVGSTAYLGTTAYCVSSVDRINLSMYLQKYDGGWVTIAKWANRTDSNYASLSGQYTLVSGNSYRLRSFYYAYIDDVCVETVIKNYYRAY